MTRDEFVTQYTEIVLLALQCSEKARREGLLALEDELDQEIMDEWDIFKYGLRLVVDGTDPEIIEKILSNMANQEKDEYTAILKNIQKEAILSIRKGNNTRVTYMILNSYTDITFKEDEVPKRMGNPE
jgi:flagellar motor component MotA